MNARGTEISENREYILANSLLHYNITTKNPLIF